MEYSVYMCHLYINLSTFFYYASKQSPRFDVKDHIWPIVMAYLQAVIVKIDNNQNDFVTLDSCFSWTHVQIYVIYNKLHSRYAYGFNTRL